jgi:hypothetical protein
MEVLKLTTTIDASGQLHLDLQTHLAAGTVDVVVVLNASAENQPQHYDFSDLVGRLTWQGDAVTMQKILRDEW